MAQQIVKLMRLYCFVAPWEGVNPQIGIQAVHRLCSSWRIYAGVVHGPNDGARISPLGLCQLREYPPAGPHDPPRGRSPLDTPLVLACGDSSVSRVGRSRRVERQAPMTVRLRPLIKPDGRISRIRLSESNSAPRFAPRARVRVDDVHVKAAYPLSGPSAAVAP